jgi:peptide chain release factor 1
MSVPTAILRATPSNKTVHTMTTIPKEKLDHLVQRWETLQTELSKGGLDQQTFAKLSKEFSDLNPIVGAIQALRSSESERADLKALIAGDDADMKAMAEPELIAIEPRIEKQLTDLTIMLLPKDEADDRNAILEVRAGTGGDEAALFAGDLFRMYSRYADLQGWKTEVISASESEMGGYKEIIANISGKGVFARMKYESGVHRVQRVPATEGAGRIHTSAATVAVLPEAQEVDIEIRMEDVRLDTMRSSGAGGQHVNTTDSAVRLLHLPTGIIITSNEKSQHQNRARVFQVLRTRLYDLERQKIDNERSAARKSQIGTGDRSARIRTYNFPQGRCTDHRINITLYSLARLMEGNGLDELVDALIADHQTKLLAEMNEGGE